MKKKINIEKKIDFTKMISEVTAISLEHDLKFIDEENIEGNLIVAGKYKSTVASQLEEDFNYKIPVEISLTEKLDLSSSRVDITDFSYDVFQDSALVCKIELLVDGLEIIDDERECDGDPIEEKEFELPKIEEKKEREEEIEDVINNDISDDNNCDNSSEEVAVINEDILEEDEDAVDDSLLFNIDNSKETYGTFIVYIVRQNETINSILEKYNTKLEEIEKYNDIKDLSIGTKLIIPLLKDEDK